MIKISGLFRVQEIYNGENAAYVTIKDKEDGAICKIGMPLPLNPAVKDDGLVKLEGALRPRIYNSKLSLDFEGVASAVAEKA